MTSGVNLATEIPGDCRCSGPEVLAPACGLSTIEFNLGRGTRSFFLFRECVCLSVCFILSGFHSKCSAIRHVMNTGCCEMYLLNLLFSEFSVSVTMVRVDTVKYGPRGSGKGLSFSN